MIWRALTSAFSAALRRIACISNRAASAPGQTIGASGHAEPMFRTRRSDGALLSRRAELAARIRKARTDHKARKALCGEAKRLTTRILAGRHGRG